VHTNDAPSAVARLLDLSLEPYLVSATLETVVAQRLVRRICPDCTSTYEPDEDLLAELGAHGDGVRGRSLSYGRGCDRCYHTGYRGRTALFEIMQPDDAIRAAIQEGASTEELREHARAAGMTSLRESGMRAVLAGVTTVEEVLRETLR
jgi:type IV pilus assembly protein PilB